MKMAILFLVAVTCAVAAEPAPKLHFLLSGHSLTDSPIDEYTARIGESLGVPTTWEKQNMPGSPISSRTIGHRQDAMRPNEHPWTGYAAAHGRGGLLDAVSALRRPQQPFTHLVVAERHDSLGPLQWENTVRLLRHFYELAREGSPGVQGVFYTTWADVVGQDSNKDDPGGWIRHEKAQQKLWECIPARINDSLAQAGRKDRLITLPASGALAELVEQSTTGNLPGVTQTSVRATMDYLFSDDVHLTRAGQYFIACVTFATLARRSPQGAWHPEEVSAETAATLQQVAGDYVEAYFRGRPLGPQPNVQERLALAAEFAPIFWSYRGQPGQGENDARFFSRQDLNNPLWFSPEADESGYWFPRLP